MEDHTITAMHPYEDRITTYVYSGMQYFDDEQFPLYTTDNGNGTTVSLDTIIRRNPNVLDNMQQMQKKES